MACRDSQGHLSSTEGGLVLQAASGAVTGRQGIVITCSPWVDDEFHACQPLWSNAVDATYFSTVTITTVGYGDFSPERWPGKLLVASELCVGLVLIIVTFQRTLAGIERGSSSGRPSATTE